MTLSGSLGNIGKPLTRKLIEEGHTITVISSNPVRSEAIKALGATPAIGKLQDTTFLASAFRGADAVYTMVPPPNYFDQDLNLLGYYRELGNRFAEAIKQTGVNRVVNTSSIGAHLEEGSGILLGTHHVENILNDLPDNVAITHVRPTEIYHNLFSHIGLIKSQGIMAGNLEEDGFNSWVSPQDIATAVAEELNATSPGRNVRYVASEELTYQELARTLGVAIGKPDLKWVTLSDDQMVQSLESVGMQPAIARGMAEMYAAIRSEKLYEDYKRHRPELGRVKTNDFAQEFAAVYHQK